MIFSEDEPVQILAKQVRARNQVLFVASHSLLIETRKRQLLEAAGGYIGVRWATLGQLADSILEACGKAYIRVDQSIREDLVESTLLQLQAQGKLPNLQTGLRHAGFYKSIALWIEDMQKGYQEKWAPFLKTATSPILQDLYRVYQTYLATIQQSAFSYKETEQVLQIAAKILKDEPEAMKLLADVAVIEGHFSDTQETRELLQTIARIAPCCVRIPANPVFQPSKAVGNVRFLNGNTLYDEVRNVIEDIRETVDKEVPEREILIVTPNQTYSRLVKRELRAQGLSTHGSRTASLLELSVAQRILSLLQLQKSYWDREKLVMCARLYAQVMKLSDDEIAWGREQIEASGITADYRNWLTFFRGHAARCKTRLENLHGLGNTEQVTRHLSYATKWMRFLYRLNSRIQSIPLKGTWEQYLETALLLIEADQKANINARTNALQWQQFEMIRNCLRTRCEIARAFATERELLIPLKRFLNWFQERFAFIQMKFANEAGGIQVSSPEEIYGASFTRVYVLGLVEDSWPRSFDPHWIWDLCKRLANGTDLAAPNADDQLKEDEQLFNWSIAVGQEQIVLSGPLRGERGRSTTVSRFVTNWLGEMERQFLEKQIERSYSQEKIYSQSQRPAFFNSQIPLRVTGIDLYAKCAFRYFAGDVLSVKESLNRGEGLLPTDIGSMMHQVLRMLIDESISSPQELLKRAEELLDSELEEYQRRYGFAGLKWEGQCRISKREFLEFVATEAEQFIQKHQLKQIPEWGFGKVHAEKMDSSSTPEPLILRKDGREIQITGIIDRIDQSEDGYSIVDYKLSTSPTRQDIELGDDLQMALYLMAYFTLADLKRKPYGGRFAVLRDASKGGNIEFDSIDEFEDYTNQIRDRVFQLVERMQSGDAMPRPRDLSDCKRCSYASVCRRDEF